MLQVRRLLAILLLGVLAGAAWAQLPMHSPPLGTKGVAVTYTAGPGNVDTNWLAWYGFRAFSVADLGNKLINVCNASDVACVDMSSSVTTGALVITTVGGTNCTASPTTCTIKTMYDRTGHGNDVTQATIASRPTLNASAVNSLPCAQFALASTQNLQRATLSSSAASWTFSSVAERTGSTTVYQEVIGANSAAAATMGFNNTANTVQMYDGGSTLTVTGVNDNIAHRFNLAAPNSGTLVWYIDGTSHSLGAASNDAVNNPLYLGLHPNGSSFPLQGYICEAGVENVAASGTILGNLDTNQHGFWGI